VECTEEYTRVQQTRLDISSSNKFIA